MGVVASQTVFIFFSIFDLLRTMHPLIYVLHHVIVAIQTGIQMKKIFQVFVHFCWIGVETPGDVRMTVLAGILSMGRDMKLPGIHEPRGQGKTLAQND
jgi:hypothetical protein